MEFKVESKPADWAPEITIIKLRGSVDAQTAPMFEKDNPNVTVKAVGTGPGDGGSQKIVEKIDAQKATAAWDVDVAVVHQKMAGDMVKAGLLAPYTKDIASGKLTTSQTAKNALGQNVEGYVIPMFQSQTAIAYNPAMVKQPPKTLDCGRKSGFSRSMSQAETSLPAA